jgi:2-oxoisovalerate dehydrogenase E1 component alpha subunit
MTDAPATGASKGAAAPRQAASTPRHRSLGLTDQDVVRMYETVVTARLLDERNWILNRQGKAAFVISCQGQEAAQVGSAAALRPERDWLVPYYRDLAAVLWFGMTPREILLSQLARAGDPSSGGRQMPGHFGARGRRILSGGSPVATQILHAAGIALASKMRKRDEVTACYFGEGSTSQGDFHEGLNFAGVHKLAVIYICENNGYAISVPQSKQMAIKDVAQRAEGYGMPGTVVDGNDALAVFEATQRAFERARAGEGPSLIEAKTYRLQPHSSDDDDKRYRQRDEVEEWRAKDPVLRFQTYLLSVGVLDAAGDQALRERQQAVIDEATEYAEAAAFPLAEDALKNVYAEGEAN